MHRGRHKKPCHKKDKPLERAGGGHIYEKEMRGEKPTHNLTKINYEKNMNGEKKMKKVPKVMKFAMGGVGKIRHDEATKDGMPIKKRHQKFKVK